MKGPLVALLVADDPKMREKIANGEKTLTIREGFRDYRPGQTVMLCCHLEPWAVMADITEVRHCQVKELTEEEARADGQENLKELFKALRNYYPRLTGDSFVTIIRWTNVRGKLVEQCVAPLTAPLG